MLAGYCVARFHKIKKGGTMYLHYDEDAIKTRVAIFGYCDIAESLGFFLQSGYEAWQISKAA
jgi:hypothetical protein